MVSKWVTLFWAIRLWRLRWHLWRPSFLCCAKDAAKVFQKWPQSWKVIPKGSQSNTRASKIMQNWTKITGLPGPADCAKRLNNSYCFGDLGLVVASVRDATISWAHGRLGSGGWNQSPMNSKTDYVWRSPPKKNWILYPKLAPQARQPKLVINISREARRLFLFIAMPKDWQWQF